MTVLAGALWSYRAARQHAPMIRNWWWTRQCVNYQADSAQPAAGKPDCWSHMDTNHHDTRTYTTAFLHGRTSAKGAARLVAVDDWIDSYVDAGAPPGEKSRAQDLHLRVTHLIPEALWQEHWANPEVYEGATNVHVLPLGYGKKVVIFNGAADPADPARFQIFYELDGVRGEIDGRLTDTDDPQLPTGVEFKLASGPGLPFQ